MVLALSMVDFFVIDGNTADALPSRYNYTLVLVSYLIATLASYAFLQFAGRIIDLRYSVVRFAWLGAGAVIMGGGIWAMHFVGMLAYILPIPVAYEIVPTALSVVPAILAAAIALHVVARPTVTMPRLLIGGTLMGAGIGAMHYGGMAAMSVSALVRYEPALFATSIVAAVALAILALQVRFWVNQRGTGTPGRISSAPQEIVGAMILGFAVTAMHYIAMASTFCFANPGDAPLALDAEVFAGVTAVIASLVLVMAITAVAFDRRMKVEIAMREAADLKVAAEIERLNSVFQSTGAVVLMLGRDSRILMANRAVLEMIGLTGESIAGRPVDDLQLAGFDEGVLERWRTATDGQHLLPVELECRRTGRDGAMHVYRLTVNPVPDQTGELRYIVVIGVDDTERRQAEIRLFDTSRLANLGEMATGMAHEINQPLTVIRMAADTVCEELEMPDAAAIPREMSVLFRENLARISKQTERAAALVQNMRTVARKPANDLQPFDISAAMRAGDDLLHEQLKAERIAFSLDLPPPGLMVLGNAGRLQQVIINLVLNARDELLMDATRPSTGRLGQITLRVTATSTGGAELTVEDDGPGIPAHVLPRLFEPFFTTKPTGKGTGLGLSICYDIVKWMGGNIAAENRPEGGARFRIMFPPSHRDSPATQTAA